MTTLAEIKDTLWLYSTHERHPFQVSEAFINLKDGGDLVIDGLIWGLQQGDVDLKLLVLSLLQQFCADAKRALPAVRALISDEEHRLVRVTAINPAHVWATRATGASLVSGLRLLLLVGRLSIVGLAPVRFGPV